MDEHSQNSFDTFADIETVNPNDEANFELIFGNIDDINLCNSEHEKLITSPDSPDGTPEEIFIEPSYDTLFGSTDDMDLSAGSPYETIIYDPYDEYNTIYESGEIIEALNSVESPLKEKPTTSSNSEEENYIRVMLPRVVATMGREMYLVRFPNFISAEPRPFDSITYDDEFDEEETMDEEGRLRIKLKANSTIRWRKVLNRKGTWITESNTRMVRWSDGSYTMHLGSEIFHVDKIKMQSDDFQHIFIHQAQNFDAQTILKHKLSFRPHSTDSITHRRMTMSLADRSFNRPGGIKVLTQVGVDPTMDRKERIKKAHEDLRKSLRVDRNQRLKNIVARSSRNVKAAPSRFEISDDENTISLNAIKNTYKNRKTATNPNTVTNTGNRSDNEWLIPEQKRRRISNFKRVNDNTPNSFD